MQHAVNHDLCILTWRLSVVQHAVNQNIMWIGAFEMVRRVHLSTLLGGHN
jgi:hypothetical protein